MAYVLLSKYTAYTVHIHTYINSTQTLGKALQGEPHLAGREATSQLSYFMDLLSLCPNVENYDGWTT